MRTTKTGIRDSPQRDDTHSRHISLESAHHNRSTVHHLDGQEKVSSQGLVDATTRGSHQARSRPRGAAGCIERCSPRGNGSCRISASSNRRMNMERHG